MAAIGVIEWGVATLPLPGEAESGDRYLVTAFPGGVLVAAIDGLGHGAEAVTAAELAVATLEQRPHAPLPALVRRCHEALRTTRGAVMSLASFNTLESTMTWLGVGNVEGKLLRARAEATAPHESIVLRAGVVGYKLPPLHASVHSVEAGDTLLFATDGVDDGFGDGPMPQGDPQRVADRILTTYGKGTDDALVLVARYLGVEA